MYWFSDQTYKKSCDRSMKIENRKEAWGCPFSSGIDPCIINKKESHVSNYIFRM